VPEGDILRRTAAALDRALTGAVVVRTELRWPTAAGTLFDGATVLGTHAYGKHLFTRFDDGRTLHTHLRMEGYWRTHPSGSAPARARDPFIRAVLGTAAWTAVGHRLGMLDVVPTSREHTLVAHLGPDVLADDFPESGLPEALARVAARGTTPIAEVLLDQTVAAGLGTIYMAESLFARRVWPWTPADRTDAATLYMVARTLMQRSVAALTPTATGETARGRGTRVHGRAGEPCPRCGTPVAVGTARRPPMERPVFWCPTCQAAPPADRRVDDDR
jgi:endonuclease-8